MSMALMPKEPSPCSTSTWVSGLATLGAHAVGQADPHGAERPRVEPVAGDVGRDGLAAEVQDLLAVDDQDRVAPQEVTHLLAEAQRMDGRVSLLIALSISDDFSASSVRSLPVQPA